jgi:hypothetical protein
MHKKSNRAVPAHYSKSHEHYLYLHILNTNRIQRFVTRKGWIFPIRKASPIHIKNTLYSVLLVVIEYHYIQTINKEYSRWKTTLYWCYRMVIDPNKKSLKSEYYRKSEKHHLYITKYLNIRSYWWLSNTTYNTLMPNPIRKEKSACGYRKPLPNT